ncbi:hypothetical protein [Shinella zoogloeoides]|nr:hypothetical protein [Shinella zoogloeoides]
MEDRNMLADLTTIFLEVIRILTFQSGRPAPPRHRKAVVNHSDTDRMR